MNRLHDIERYIDGKLRSLFSSPAAAGTQRELVEVHRAILDEVSTRIERLPRDRTVFPYALVEVSVQVPEPARRRAYEVVFLEGGALEREIRTRLEEEGAELPANFAVAVHLADDLTEPYAITYKAAPPPAEPAPTVRVSTAPVPIRLTITHGAPDADGEKRLRARRINLGRLAEVFDAGQRLVRRNEVSFADASTPPNSTVSRSHAHLEFDPGSGRYRIFDDRSAYGTTVSRSGQIISVPRGAGRGVALEPGDEILLGQARVRFEIDDAG